MSLRELYISYKHLLLRTAGALGPTNFNSTGSALWTLISALLAFIMSFRATPLSRLISVHRHCDAPGRVPRLVVLTHSAVYGFFTCLTISGLVNGSASSPHQHVERHIASNWAAVFQRRFRIVGIALRARLFFESKYKMAIFCDHLQMHCRSMRYGLRWHIVTLAGFPFACDSSVRIASTLRYGRIPKIKLCLVISCQWLRSLSKVKMILILSIAVNM